MSAPGLSEAGGVDPTREDVATSLRHWTTQVQPNAHAAAAVELLIRYGLAEKHHPWIVRGVLTEDGWWVGHRADFRKLAQVGDSTPGQDGVVMRIAAHLGSGIAVMLRGPNEALDPERKALVVAALTGLDPADWPPPRSDPPMIPDEVFEEERRQRRRTAARLIAMDDEDS